MSDREWSIPDLRDLHADVRRIRDHDLGNRRMRELLGATLDTLVAADAEYAALSTPTTPDEESDWPTKWAGKLAVGNMIANLRTLPADMPIHSAYHVVRGDKPSLLFVKTPTLSRERVDGREIKTGDESVPYSAVIWSHPCEPDPAAFRPSEGEGLREALVNLLAWAETIKDKTLVGDEGCIWPVEAARAALNNGGR